MPDGSPTRSTGGDVNNNGPTKCMNGACGGYGPSSTGGGGGAGDSPAAQPRRVQVTAKILFGSVNAISTMKQNDKLHRKKSQWPSSVPIQQQRRRRPAHRPPPQPPIWAHQRRHLNSDAVSGGGASTRFDILHLSNKILSFFEYNLFQQVNTFY